MSLVKAKLNNLKKKTASDVAGKLNTTLDLRAQMRRMTIRQGHPSRGRLNDEGLAAELGAECIAPGLLLRRCDVSFGETHGGIGLSREALANTHLPGWDDLATKNLVFFDTETSGLSGGSGTHVFVVGLAKINFAANRIEAYQYLLSAFSGEAEMLQRVGSIFEDADVCVSYNGKSFDTPLLETRFRMHRLESRLNRPDHLDLLYLVRRLYKRHWPDCRLARVERKLLGFRRHDDLPGSEAPQVWFEWMRFGRHERLGAVLKHNYWDLISLVAALVQLGEVVKQPAQFDADILGLASLLRKQGLDETALMILLENRSKLGIDGLRELALSLKRNNDWEDAQAIWLQLSTDGCVESTEQLAKYYEHQRHDYVRALASTHLLIERQGSQLRHRHRQQRLLAKLTQKQVRTG